MKRTGKWTAKYRQNKEKEYICQVEGCNNKILSVNTNVKYCWDHKK